MDHLTCWNCWEIFTPRDEDMTELFIWHSCKDGSITAVKEIQKPKPATWRKQSWKRNHQEQYSWNRNIGDDFND